jgi:flavin reductase (DIM6/NTAB) family NADH-FMN oxidoreductase RutF
MKKRGMRPGTMLNPVPAVLVSCRDKGKNNLITIAWTGIVNSEPPLTYISVRKSRFSHEMIKNSGEFVINMVSEELTAKMDICGVRSGRDMDKFKECGLTPVKGDIVNAPMVDEAVVNLECVVRDVISYPSHDMFVAEIMKVHAAEKLFDDTNRLCLEDAGLVCFCHGEYYGIKKHPIGRLGYSVMKPKTRRRVNRETMDRKRTKRNSLRKPR